MRVRRARVRGVSEMSESESESERKSESERSERSESERSESERSERERVRGVRVTGLEPKLPPDLTSDTSPAPAAEDNPEYVETIRQWFQFNPPADGRPACSSLAQSLPRGQPSLCTYHPSRKNLQAGTQMERTIPCLPHPQRLPGDIRG